MQGPESEVGRAVLGLPLDGGAEIGDRRYRALVERWERQLESRDGTDKSWVEHALAEAEHHYRRAHPA